MEAFSAKDADRFWSKVDRSGGADACWPWTATRSRDGYGRFRLGGRPVSAHRLAFVLAGGTLTEDEPQVLHRCDNPPCCNAAHLFRGSVAANVADMSAKERRADFGGERNGRAKVTARQVGEIRRRHAAGEPQTALAREFGIVQAAVSYMVRGVTWRSVKGGAD